MLHFKESLQSNWSRTFWAIAPEQEFCETRFTMESRELKQFLFCGLFRSNLGKNEFSTKIGLRFTIYEPVLRNALN